MTSSPPASASRHTCACSHVELDGVLQPAAAPRLSRTPGAARPAERDADAALDRWSLDADERDRLRAAGVLTTPAAVTI